MNGVLQEAKERTKAAIESVQRAHKRILMFYDGAELKKVKCPRKFIPPLSLDVCKMCRWHVSIQIPVDEDNPPYVVCHLEGEWYNAVLLP